MTTPSGTTGATSAPLAAIARHPWYVALALLLIGLVVLVALWDWNWFKDPVERYVQAKTGRHLVIGGDLDVHLGRTTVVRADGVVFGNAPWSKVPEMARADRLEFGVHIWPLLLHRDIQIPDIRLTRPRLLLETGPNHVGNWVLPSSGGKAPEFNQVRIDQGHLQFIDAVNRSGLDVDINSRKVSGSATPTIDVIGKGLWKGSPFNMQGVAESPLALRDTDRPYRIDMSLAAGATRAHARGRLLDPLGLRDFDLQLAIDGKNMADLFPLIGVATPPTPAYQLDGHLGRTGDIWHYDGFAGKVGTSDIAGSASIDHSHDRPKLTAKVSSQHMDIADLGGFLGTTPGSVKKGTAAPSVEAHALPAGKLFPDTPYNLAKLRAMDADVRVKVEHLSATAVPMENMDAHLLLESGVLRLDPLNFGVADGSIRGTIRMDARGKVLGTQSRIQARGLNLSKLIPSAKFGKSTIGRVGGDFSLHGSGNSIAAMLGNANGEAGIGMGNGEVSKLLMKLAGLDLGGVVKVLVTGDEQIPIRCGMGDFTVHNGIMTTQNLAIDTSDNTLQGQGDLSLKDESLQLQFTSRSKRFSLVSLRGPILVTGTLRNPNVRPDYKRVGLRAAAAAVIGVVAAPVAALVATAQKGREQDIPCGKYGGPQAATKTH
jgi:uncharacterized protein involved in outer membrane biogenesis